MKSPEYIVSGCLAGRKCRYDGDSRPCAEVIQLVKMGRAITICPESMSGLPVPRPPAEQQPDGTIRDKTGRNVSSEFERGAKKALDAALASGCKKAILKDRSPSCGSSKIYDGSFTGTLKEGAGIFTQKLRHAGIEVISEEDFISGLH